MSSRKARLREEVHPKVLKQVSFASEVTIKEFKKDAHPSSRYGTKLVSRDSLSPALRISSRNEIPNSIISHSEEIANNAEVLVTDGLKIEEVSDILKESNPGDNSIEESLERNDTSGSEEDDDDCTTPEEKLESSERTKPLSMKSLREKFSFKKEKRKKPKKIRLKNYFRRRTILLVGDMACGKSSIVKTYCKDRFPEVYTPTILHCCESDAKIAGQQVKLKLVDVPGRYDYKPIRCIAFKNIDIAILCYSAGDMESFEHIQTHWLPELKECAPNCPFVLAETKKDIRDEFDDAQEDSKLESLDDKSLFERIVPSDAGEKLAKETGALGFYSCSAKFRIGTRSLMEGATLLALKKSRRKKQSRQL